MIQVQEDVSKIHVVFLHNRLGKRPQDRYLINLATAIKNNGHKVTIYTTECDKYNAFEEINSLTGNLDVKYSSWWVPHGFNFLKSTIMAINIILFPPNPKPNVIFLDINTVALFILAMYSNFKTVYLANFYRVHKNEDISKFIIPKPLSAYFLNYADEIIVQSKSLKRIFERSFRSYKRRINVVYPAMDTGLWKEESLDITTILPCIAKQILLFVCFGNYTKKSNFSMVLEAFEDVLTTVDDRIKNNLHLVLAGTYNQDCEEQLNYFTEISGYVQDKTFNWQVSFIKELTTIHKKTLIEKSVAIIVPCSFEVFPDNILAGLAAGKPVIATNTGFARESLKHRLTGILVKPEREKFAEEMGNVLSCPSFHNFLSTMAKDVFREKYSSSILRKNLNEIINKYAQCI